jgi:hypothetical protein
VLDAAGMDAWSDHYAHFSKRARAGMFTSGKYLVLILLADTIDRDAAQRLAGGFTPGFLEIPDVIDRGGGHTVVVIQDPKKLLTPKKIVLWDIVRATEFVKRTHQAVVDYVKAISPAASPPKDKLGAGTVVAEKSDLGR